MESKLFDSIILTSAEGWDTDDFYDEAHEQVELTGTKVSLLNEKLFEDFFSYSYHNGLIENELVEPLEENVNLEELFEQVYYECRVKPSLFEQLLALREMENEQNVIQQENKAEQEMNAKIEGLIFLDNLTKMTRVLSTKKPEIIIHNSIGDRALYAGEAKKRAFGLKYIIFSRVTDNNYNKTDDQITAILALICSALHDGKPEKSGDGFRIIKNGIATIIENRMTRKGQEVFCYRVMISFQNKEKQQLLYKR
jgi:hypothetical protein